MSVKTFVDTNVLIYAHDLDAKEKHAIAKETLAGLWAERAVSAVSPLEQEAHLLHIRLNPARLEDHRRSTAGETRHGAE